MKIFKMAMGNVKKYWRHYIIVGLFVLGGTVFLLSKTMIQETDYITKKEYNTQTYGNWFVRLNKEKYDHMLEGTYSYFDFQSGEYLERPVQDAWNDVIKEAGDYQYTFVYDQGKYQDLNVGYIDQNSYSLFGIHLVDGKERVNQNDLLIHEQVAKETGLKLGDEIQLDLSSEPFIITGIYSNQNEDMPVILTNINEGIVGDYYSNNAVVKYDVGFQEYIFYYYTYVGGYSVSTKVKLDYTINPHGYDANAENVKFDQNFNKLQSFVQMIVLLSLVISVLTTTSLKRRTKESTLLRGIGATAGQLILLIIDEMSVVLLITTTLGYLISNGILRYYGHMKSSIYGFYHYQYSQLLIFAYCIGIIVTIITITFLPMRSSAIGALTGAFEAPKPKMLEGRETKWVPQTSRVMAKRQLSAYSKLTLALMVFITIIGGYYLTYRAILVSDVKEEEVGPYDHKVYHHMLLKNEEDLNTYQNFYYDDETLYTIPSKSVDKNAEGSIVPIYDEFVSQFELKEGQLPTKTHEVLVHNNTKLFDEIYNLDEHDIPLYYLEYPVFLENGVTYDYYRDQDGNFFYYVHSLNEWIQDQDYSHREAMDFVVIDGQMYKYCDYNIDDNGEIIEYIIYDVNGDIVNRIPVEGHEIYDSRIGQEMRLVYQGKVYKDYVYKNNKIAIRENPNENYIEVSNASVDWIPKYAIVDGKEIYNYSLIKDENGCIQAVASQKEAKVNDTITIENESYVITGIIADHVTVENKHPGGRWHEQYTLYENDHIYLLEEDYEKLEGNKSWYCYGVFDYDRKDELINYLFNHFQLDTEDIRPLFNSFVSRVQIIDPSSFDGTFFIILVICSIALCLFLTLNNMLNDIKNYAILYLLGMEKNDIIKMHFNMALVMTIRSIVLLAIYFIFLKIGFSYTIDLLTVIVIIAGTFVCYSCIYMIPAIYMTKTNLLETLMGEE